MEALESMAVAVAGKSDFEPVRQKKAKLQKKKRRK